MTHNHRSCSTGRPCTCTTSACAAAAEVLLHGIHAHDHKDSKLERGKVHCRHVMFCAAAECVWYGLGVPSAHCTAPPAFLIHKCVCTCIYLYCKRRSSLCVAWHAEDWAMLWSGCQLAVDCLCTGTGACRCLQRRPPRLFWAAASDCKAAAC